MSAPDRQQRAGEESDFHAEWERALAELELDVTEAERLLQAVRGGSVGDVPEALGSWTPPAGIGRLPGSLVERASLVRARQLAVIVDMTSAVTRSRQHLEIQRRMRPDDATVRPMFVDAAF